MHTKKVLLVDDEREQVEILAAYISDLNGFSCKACFSGARALEYIEKEYFDWLILDLVMPEVGGLQVLRELQKKNIKTKVMVLSGFLDAALTAQCKKFGAYLVLDKPVESEYFKMLLKRSRAGTSPS